ncbi:MAG: phenylalanine--tRNA ligase subunit beta [Desulfobacteraceae bacterium]|nr:MAG: phenylalanine--tRNA ligase subunit beta [Desulfobacteraceae bacterium]
MKISTNWLNQYVSIDIPVSELADKLTMAGLEVEGVVEKYDYLGSVVVGSILEVKKHPNADYLRLCDVKTGERTISVVCAAPNAQKGMKVPCALPGTILPGGLVIQKNTIRDFQSEGMLCSEAELSLGSDKSGLMVLDSQLIDGTPLNKALNLSDTIMEIGLTPNRPDCLSFIGIAREVATMVNQPLKLPEISLPQASDRIDDLTSVTIRDPDLCPRYAARLITGVTVAPSPFWLQERLLSVDLKPINNIVDITNFVMMEMGQPLHAFDFDHLAGHRIVVRAAAPNEAFTTLDDKERRLTGETLMICDGEKPVAVAGVMGGQNSEIETTTTQVLLESACFNPVSIRKTAKYLGLNTDASHRFERGVDPAGTLTALNRAAQLIVEIAGGCLVGGIIDEHPAPAPVRRIQLSTAATNRRLGTRLDQSEIIRCLESVEFQVTVQDTDALTADVPPFRVDVSRPEDLMEEVARLWGYNNIQTTIPKISPATRPISRSIEIKDKIKDRMAGYGFSETISYSFIAKNACDLLNLPENDERRNLLLVLNPISEDQAVMRTSLIPSLLASMHYNLSRQTRNLKIFELGKIFISKSQDQQPDEIETLAGLWTGVRSDQTWHDKPVPCDFYDVKGVLENLLVSLEITGISFSQMPAPSCHYTKPGHTARILCNGAPAGLIGEISPSVLANFDVKQPAFIFELNVSYLIAHDSAIKMFVPVPRFPSTDRDITLIVDSHIQVGDIIDKTKLLQEGLEEKWIEGINVLDVYTGQPIPSGKKSISFRITYRSFTETLLDQQVNRLHQQLTNRIIEEFNAALPA